MIRFYSQQTAIQFYYSDMSGMLNGDIIPVGGDGKLSFGGKIQIRFTPGMMVKLHLNLTKIIDAIPTGNFTGEVTFPLNNSTDYGNTINTQVRVKPVMAQDGRIIGAEFSFIVTAQAGTLVFSTSLIEDMIALREYLSEWKRVASHFDLVIRPKQFQDGGAAGNQGGNRQQGQNPQQGGGGGYRQPAQNTGNGGGGYQQNNQGGSGYQRQAPSQAPAPQQNNQPVYPQNNAPQYPAQGNMAPQHGGGNMMPQGNVPQGNMMPQGGGQMPQGGPAQVPQQNMMPQGNMQPAQQNQYAPPQNQGGQLPGNLPSPGGVPMGNNQAPQGAPITGGFLAELDDVLGTGSTRN